MTQVLSSKLCSKCGVEKPIDQYQKNRARLDGVETYCRECNNARLREKYAKDPEYRVLKSSKNLKTVTQTNLIKPVCYIAECTQISKTKGLCKVHYAKEWHIAHREERLEKIKIRLVNDPKFKEYRRSVVARKERERRAQKANTEVTKVTAKDYEEILISFDNKCWICEQPLTAVFWDHVHPLSKGGPHTKDNLRPACNPCNVRKNSLWPFTDEMKERIANEVRSLPTFKEVMP